MALNTRYTPDHVTPDFIKRVKTYHLVSREGSIKAFGKEAVEAMDSVYLALNYKTDEEREAADARGVIFSAIAEKEYRRFVQQYPNDPVSLDDFEEAYGFHPKWKEAFHVVYDFELPSDEEKARVSDSTFRLLYEDREINRRLESQ